MKINRPTIHIVTGNFLSDESGRRVIGGVETYIAQLLRVLRDEGFCIAVYQFAQESFSTQWENVPVTALADAHRRPQTLVRAAENAGNPQEDILLFATDYLITRSHFCRVVAVQHGIAWDMPGEPSQAANYRRMVTNLPRTIRKYRRFCHCTDIVCVDYNFLNWYRTQVAFLPQRVHVIPNFACPTDGQPESKRGLSLLFARRFVPYRGTRLLTPVLKRLLSDYEDLHVTLAGEGPDEAWLHAQFPDDARVTITQYSPEQSGTIHGAHAIAVVPTTGSEGTSLSLLEAMGAGCAVVATNVGGMTNILLNGYNGLLVQPEEADLECALRTLLDDAQMRQRLGARARETIQEAFSFQRWRKSWLELIDSL